MQLVVGRVGRAHGVRGDVFVDLRTDEPEVRFAPGSSVLLSAKQELIVDSARVNSGRLLVHFVGVDSREAAEALRNQDLVVDVDPDQLPEDEDEFYDHQLVGLTAVLVDGNEVGEVIEVVHLPGQDLLAIKAVAGNEVLVPFVHQIVPEVDLANQRVVLTPPPGLLDETEVEVVREEEA